MTKQVHGKFSLHAYVEYIEDNRATTNTIGTGRVVLLDMLKGLNDQDHAYVTNKILGKYQTYLV